MPPSTPRVIPITRHINVAKRLRADAKPKSFAQHIRVAQLFGHLDSLLFLIGNDHRDLILVDITQLDFALLDLLDKRFFFDLELFCFKVDLLALLLDLS